mmetsp:Transcript_129440/g.258416  ORF Transcript_129440/g.258416 Transcript_129440/m.258416 type:complete len:224 (+) Transcript_129440:74-745(+)|eukprot:CAMPEP_0172725782 /NCGR_PEP_ID=MMETSP1074-20121228/89288_1 /TAXON_ID=2916 /ORGANISM="Ceratium fusus, Strain PA161109" /LENGTH=223 /DNA_ID=CAMNT_0013552641 /DNA_START=74 /DNA_END=745 /DNA_ORIENTATION=+
MRSCARSLKTFSTGTLCFACVGTHFCCRSFLSLQRAAIPYTHRGRTLVTCRAATVEKKEDVIQRIRARRQQRRKTATAPKAPEAITDKVVSIIQSECPSYDGKIVPATTLAEIEGGADSMDTLEAMMELEDKFKVELEDEWMEQVKNVQELADLIYRTPRGLKLRTVDDETYIAMIRRSHAENRWGELDDLENNIPPQYEHKGPSLAEQDGVVPPGTSWPEQA